MTGSVITLELDADVPVVPLLKAIAKEGLRFSNLDGCTFRIHRPPAAANVIDLATRRQAGELTDAQMRAGMRALFISPDEQVSHD